MAVRRTTLGAQMLIAGNWKMNGLTADRLEARRIAEGAGLALEAGVRVAICPPATLIGALSMTVSVGARLGAPSVAIGGQDCHAKTSGAHTGDISAAMLADQGASLVILGHSERRADHGETSESVAAKVVAAQAAGLRPIVCVGESLAERDAGKAKAVVLDQLARSLPAQCAPDLAIAYEPVWAIGTGRTASNADIAAMHADIRAALAKRFGPAAERVPVLYGGSVNPGNAASILAVPGVGGALVGGASLKATDFLAIIEAARAALAP